MRTKFSFLLCACICVCVFACWPLMCIWWNMSADFRVITTSVVDVHPISAVANSALCVICTNCGVLFVRFARFAALTLGLSTVPHFKLSIHSTFYFSVSRHSVKPGNATCCANVHPTGMNCTHTFFLRFLAMVCCWSIWRNYASIWVGARTWNCF